MQKSRMVNTKIWDDNYFSNLDPIEKLLFFYFLTNTSTNISGIYEIPLKKVANETGIDKEMVQKILDRFANDEKIFYCYGWVCVKNFVKNQKNDSPTVKIGIRNEIALVPKDILDIFIRYGYGMGAISHLIQSNLIKSNLTKEVVSSKEDTFDKFWEAYPKKELKKKTLEIWKRKKLDVHLVAILEFITVAQKTDRWKKGYIKQPPAFLNGECWNDDVSTYNDRVGSQGKSVAIIQ